MGATVLNIPELVIQRQEASALAEAVAGVLQHYPMAFAPQYVAWGNLAAVAIGVYGTRMYAYSQRMKESAAAKMMPPPPPQGPAAAAGGTKAPGQKVNGHHAPVTPADLFGFAPPEYE
jgi:hypothetical protein